MSKPSRLARPLSANPGSKLPSPRRETTAARPKIPSVGEKLPRTGSEGNLTGQNPPANGAVHTHLPHHPHRKGEEEGAQHRSKTNPPKGAVGTVTQQPAAHHKPLKGNLKVTSPEDAEHLHCRPAGGTAPSGPSANGQGARGDSKASRAGVPRRHTVGGARSSREILAMQPSDMDKKREAFLEHLKQKYPHHASAIMGHQERLREQCLQEMLSSLQCELNIQRYLLKIESLHQSRSRSPRQGAACPSPVPVFGEQLEQGSLLSLDVLDTMSECDGPGTFTRGSRSRASLPVVRSANQTKDRSLGVLYLQYGDDTKQIRMPNEITSADTVRALFVSAFPQQLSMKMLESPSTAIYVKDDMRNMYYELSDVRSIADQSCLKVYHKDPAQAFNHAPRPSNGEARMHREVMYAARDGPHLMRQPSFGAPPPHPMQGPMSPPTPHSMPSSPSRIPFGPRAPGVGPGGATVPRERAGHAHTMPPRSSSPSASAILERRDVKPDEDVAGKGMPLPARGEGLYADPYMLHHHGPPPDAVDHAFHRPPVRTYSGPGMPIDPVEHHSLFRQKSRKYSESQLPTLGSKTPPASPHRMADMRMIDIQSQGSVPLERSSSVRQSFRKDAPVAVDMGAKGRAPMSPDLQGHTPLASSEDPQTRERMKAMEQQIASLTGLVQHALLKGPGVNGVEQEHGSERSAKSGSPVHSTSSAGGSPVLGPKSMSVPQEYSPALTPPISSAPLQVNLVQFRKNLSELRLQLQQMRQLQLQNQECVRTQIKQAEQEIGVRLAEALARRQDDPTHRQRTLVEEERHKYLNMEERVLTQLGDLEHYLDSLRRDSGSGVPPRTVTLKEVEDGAVSLRKVGESLAVLKGEFPALQSRMRAVLRVEVEAVKFLKEEPHKLDSMLKRVKTLTDALSTLRRCATEGLLKPSDPTLTTPLTVTDGPESVPLPNLHDPTPTTVLEPQSSSVRSEVINSNPMVIHHAQSSPVPPRQSQQSAAPLAASAAPHQGRESTPSPTKQSGSPGQLKKASSAQPEPAPPLGNISNGVRRNGASSSGLHEGGTSPSLFIEEISSQSKSKNRATSIEAAEREWEEKRQNMSHYDGQEFEKMLQEAEATMLRGIPNLEVPSEGNSSAAPASAPAVALEEVAEKPQPTLVSIKEDSRPEPASSDKPTKPAPEKAPKPQVDKPAKAAVLDRPPKTSLTAKTSLERAPKPQDKAAKLSQGSEKANKSPPPPPPRRSYPTSTTGMTTTRSGEVIYTSRKESAQESERDSPTSSAPPKPRSPPEVKAKRGSPPPVTASAIPEEEDEGDKIMAELQVFQKCSVKEIGLKSLVEPQIKELRPGALLPLKDKKNTEIHEDKDQLTDENGNNTVRQSPGVIYYVTAQIAKETSEESSDHKAASQSPSSQVSHVDAPDKFQNQLQVSTDGQKNKGPDHSRSLPSALPIKQLARASSLKSQKTQPPTEEAPLSPTQGKVHVVKAPQVQVSIEERVESPTAVCAPVSLGGHDPVIPVTSANSVGLSSQQLVLGSSKARERKYEEVEDDSSAFLSPDLPGEEAPPPPDNIAFMITHTKVQALSTGEYNDLVNAKRGNVQTVTVGSKPNTKHGSHTVSESSNGPDDMENNGFSKKPVIIIFDEPMDIRSAYKRLSTIFECEEELERMLAEERIEEESEENEDDEGRNEVEQVKQKGDKSSSGKTSSRTSITKDHMSSNGGTEVTADAKHDAKKKFKFKFPKKQLAALTQAIRTGTKTGKKTLQVVVYEDEEESDGTIKQHKETKRYEITRSKQDPSKPDSDLQEPQGRTEEIRKSTYKTLDSLEQTIKQLETTISEMGPRSSEDLKSSESSKPQSNQVGEASDKGSSQKTSTPKPSNSSKGPGARKKPKPHVLPRPAMIPTAGVSVTPAPTQQNASVASPTSRMPVPVSAKARQQPGTSDRERAAKQQKLQDSQRQFRQANGSAKRSGGDPKSTSPASKIPAFSSSAGKSASQSDATNPVNSSPTVPSSSMSSSSLSSNKSSIPTPRSIPAPSSHIPSLSNGSLKLASPTHSTKALSLSTQTQNGRTSSSSSSSSQSPLSPTMLTQGAKSIRTIHTPSFVSYTRPHNGSAGKSAIPTATAAKDSS